MRYKTYNPIKFNILSLISFAIGLLLLSLLFFFIDLSTVFESIKRIALWQFGLIFVLKLVFSIIGALRWRVILDFYKQKVSLWKLYLFRFATFAVSYFTPIAAVGGQAIGVLLLKNEKVPVKIGLTTMLIDSVLTPFVTVTISFLALIIFLLAKFSGAPFLILGVLTIFLVLFFIFFLIAFRIKRTTVKKPKNNFWLRWKITIKDFLFTFSDFFRKNKKGTLYLIALSLLGHASLLFEIFLILFFLNTILGVIEVAILEAGYMFAFATPVSQALGTAEISGAYVLNLLGHSTALGVTLTLILRLRHLLIGLIGIAVLIFYGLTKLSIPKVLPSIKHK